MEIKLNVPTGGKARKWLIAGALALLLLGGGTYYAVGTPQYSVWQMKRSFRNHDVNAALKYVDIDAVVDNLFTEMSAQLAAEADQGNKEDAFGNALALGFVEALKPVLKETIRGGFIRAVQGEQIAPPGTGDDAVKDAEGLGEKIKTESYRIEMNGSTAYVRYESGTSLRLEKAADGRYWRVVAVEGLLDEQELDKSIQGLEMRRGLLKANVLDQVLF